MNEMMNSTDDSIPAHIISKTIYIIIIIIIIIITYHIANSPPFIPNLCNLTFQLMQQLAHGGKSVLSKRSPVTVWLKVNASTDYEY